MPRGPVDVFVSFTGADVAWAEWVARVAEQVGFTVRFQRWDFGAGSNFVSEMSAALEDAERLVMVTSARYWTSVMATAEWTAAFARDPGCLVPVRIEDASPPALLAPIAHVDIFEVAEADARVRVVEALRGPGRPAVPVGFPGGPRWPVTPGIFEALRRPAPLAGRDGLLAELRERLAGAGAVTLTQALAGPGGVGKTVLAAEYAWRYRSDYQLVWWVPSEQRPLILESFVRLAPRLGVRVPDDLEALPRVVHEALDAFAARWLVVFDNAPDHGSVAPFLPHGQGHVLITSRNPAWGGRHATIDVECLDRETSSRYLLARVFGEAEPPEAERAAAGALAEELGGLPLALAQAAAYVDAYGETLAGYLELFREGRAQVLADAPGPLDYQGTVHTAVALALARLAGEPAALALLELLAFLGPETIPLDVLLDDTGTVELPADLAVLAGLGNRRDRNRLGIGPLRAGLSIATCVPFDPQSKGGSEATVRVAKADLVPTGANLLSDYAAFADLEAACEQFCGRVNAREHRATGRSPVEALAAERALLHPVPATPYAAVFGQMRSVTRESTISVGGVRYSVPHRLIDERVWVREHGAELVIVHLDPAHGPLEVARHPKSTKGNPQILDEHYPADHPRGQRTPKASDPEEAAFLALGEGAGQWLVEACAAGASRVRSKMIEALTLASLFGPIPVDRALGTAAVSGRFGDGDLAALLDHARSCQPSLLPADDGHSLQTGTRGWETLGR